MPGKIIPGCSFSFGPCSFIEPKPVVNLPWHCSCHWFLCTNYILGGCIRHGANLHNPPPVVSCYSNREHFYSRVTHPFPCMQLKCLNSHMPLSSENSLCFHFHSSNSSLKSFSLYHIAPFCFVLFCFFFIPFNTLFFPVSHPPVVVAFDNCIYPFPAFFQGSFTTLHPSLLVVKSEDEKWFQPLDSNIVKH